jgi:hypothetical protein
MLNNDKAATPRSTNSSNPINPTMNLVNILNDINEIKLDGKRDGKLHVYYWPLSRLKDPIISGSGHMQITTRTILERIDQAETVEKEQYMKLYDHIVSLYPTRDTLGRLIVSESVNPIVRGYHGYASMVIFRLTKLRSLHLNGFSNHRLRNVRYFAVISEEVSKEILERYKDFLSYTKIIS